MSRPLGFWSVEDRLSEISAGGDPLEFLSATVDFDDVGLRDVPFDPRARRRWSGWHEGRASVNGGGAEVPHAGSAEPARPEP